MGSKTKSSMVHDSLIIELRLLNQVFTVMSRDKGVAEEEDDIDATFILKTMLQQLQFVNTGVNNIIIICTSE